jgi:predicted 3-demethylubiquinone-9 3-methyltransferase (glyoxalase superfamily)
MLITHQTDFPEDMRTKQMREAMHSSYDKVDAYLATPIPAPPAHKSTGQIATSLWYDRNAVEAVEFHKTVFAGTQRLRSANFPPDTDGQAGTPMTVEFTLDGHDFVVLNAGPHYKLTPAISFLVYCDTEAEVDYYWDKLVDGGALHNADGSPIDSALANHPKSIHRSHNQPRPRRHQPNGPGHDATTQLDLPTLRAANDG